jgi:glycosyltransferase involved in cell wall biosynthesis
MSAPLVSVIMAVRNGARFIAAALRSVLDQDYPSIEVIVVDGRSTDASRAIAGAIPGVRILVQGGSGLSDAWNCGIEQASGDLVAFLDSDDLWRPRQLGARVRHLRSAAPAAYAIGTAAFFVDGGGPPPRGFRPGLLARPVVAPIPGTLLIERTTLTAIGGFRTDLAIAADVDLFARLKDGCVPMTVFPEAVLLKRLHGRNLSSNAAVNNAELLSILRSSIGRLRAQRGQPA